MQRKEMRKMNESTDTKNTRMMAPPEMDCDSEDENCEIPELPEDFDGEAPTDMQEMGPGGFGGRGEFMTAQNTNPDAVWHPVAYLAMGGCSVILGILVSYACFSKFFHLRPGEAFKNVRRFVWFVVVALLLATGLAVLGYFVPIWIS